MVEEEEVEEEEEEEEEQEKHDSHSSEDSSVHSGPAAAAFSSFLFTAPPLSTMVARARPTAVPATVRTAELESSLERIRCR